MQRSENSGIFEKDEKDEIEDENDKFSYFGDDMN